MFGYLALTLSAVFTGAAFYINFAEQPARLRLEANQLLRQWAPSYKRGFIMQSVLAVLSGGCALYNYFFFTQNLFWLIGAIFILANWPFTLIGIMPTNQKLLAVKVGAADESTIEMIRYWGKLHAIRTALGISATAMFLVALS